MSDRHEKWVPVSPGTVIPAGQPYRVEPKDDSDIREVPKGPTSDFYTGDQAEAGWFVDSSWRPPLELPTEACVIRAKFAGPVQCRILFGHPNPGEDSGMTFCRAIDGLGYKADEIESFEVLWVEGERGKDAVVSWEAIDKLRETYPPSPGSDMNAVDYFLREVVGDR